MDTFGTHCIFIFFKFINTIVSSHKLLGYLLFVRVPAIFYWLSFQDRIYHTKKIRKDLAILITT
jgi:hypothetical protein